MKSIFLLCFLIPACFCRTMPSFIKPCSSSDPKQSECLVSTINTILKTFSKGIPELDVPSLDPVKLNKISIEMPGLQVLYDNSTLTGLGDGKVNDFKFNFAKNTLKMDYVGNVTLSGHYKIDGRILILPISGEGKYTNLITNMRLIMKYAAKKFTKDDGKEYWVMELVKRSYKVDKAHFNFENLFGGNKILADTTLLFLNQNWELIMNEISPPAIDQIVNVCLNAVNKFYDKVPLDELFVS